MKAIIQRGGCIGCGLCVNACPEVFRLADDGLAETYAEVTASLDDAAKEAAVSCPVSVITLED